MVWASHSGDDVLRKGLTVVPGQTILHLPSNVDHVGFAVYRSSDGQCVDLMEMLFIMEITGIVHLETGPSIQVRNSKSRLVHTIDPVPVHSKITVNADRISPHLDRGIRQSVPREANE